MIKVVVRRLISVVPTLFTLLLVVFLIVRLLPGDPAQLMLAEVVGATPEMYEKLRRDLNLDRPVHEQFILFVLNFLRGDLGDSLINRQPVLNNILAVYLHTIILAVGTILVSVAIGVPSGIIAATRRNSLSDRGAMLLATLGASMPSFWFGIILILVLGVYLRWFPVIGAGDLGNFQDILWHLAMPAFSIGFGTAALIARMTRSSMLEVLNQDYVRTARAKGAPERIVVYKHALKNALIPIVTIIGLNMGFMMGGALVTEAVFARPGVGRLLVDAIALRDYPQIQGAIFVFALSVIIVNLAVDIAYVFIDPRVKYM